MLCIILIIILVLLNFSDETLFLTIRFILAIIFIGEIIFYIKKGIFNMELVECLTIIFIPSIIKYSIKLGKYIFKSTYIKD